MIPNRKLFLALLILVLPSCANTGGRGSRLLPWNWFAPDHASQLVEANEQITSAELLAIVAAHREFSKVVIALERAGASAEVLLARRFAANGMALLSQVRPLPPEVLTNNREIVDGLLSAEPAAVAAAEKLQSQDDHDAAKTARELADLRTEKKTIEGKLIESDRNYQATAEKHRRLWFWIWGVVGGWVALQLISGLARFYPALAPVSRLAGAVAAPAVHAAYERTTAAVARAIDDAEKVSQSTADTLREYLDPPSDVADQEHIRQKYMKLP